jgi:hypothetical protein
MCYFGTFVSGKFKPSEEVSEYRFAGPQHLPKLLNDQYKQIETGLRRKKQFDSEHKLTALKRKVFSFFK